MGFVRRAGLAAAVAAAPLGLAYRFALAYRARAGYPRQNPISLTPVDLGLPFETTTVRSGDLVLPAWFIPARGGQPAKVASGFQPIMPTFQGLVTEEQLLELIEYVKSLKQDANNAQ